MYLILSSSFLIHIMIFLIQQQQYWRVENEESSHKRLFTKWRVMFVSLSLSNFFLLLSILVFASSSFLLLFMIATLLLIFFSMTRLVKESRRVTVQIAHLWILLSLWDCLSRSLPSTSHHFAALLFRCWWTLQHHLPKDVPFAASERIIIMKSSKEQKSEEK